MTITKETAIELAKEAGFAWSERQVQEVEIEKLCNLAVAHAAKDVEPVTTQQAHDMGAKGAMPTEEERLLFEAWMRGHCWAIVGKWDGKQYVSDRETGAVVDWPTMHTRQLWAVWRDRAALTHQPDDTALLRQALGQLECNTENMSKGMSKSIQRLCARENKEAITALRERLGEKV